MSSSAIIKQPCSRCDEMGAKLLCTKCKCAIYCNKECQKLHWKEHKQVCRKCDPDDLSYFDGFEKDLIIFNGNGMGGGQNVRIGYPLLTAYALAMHKSRSSYVQALRAAPGEISQNWLDVMTESEIEEVCGPQESGHATSGALKRKLDDSSI